MSKGSTRRAGTSYAEGWSRIYDKPVECPHCKEIELRRRAHSHMWECRHCKHEVQL